MYIMFSLLPDLECPIYSIKFPGVYYTSLDSGREDAEYFTLTMFQSVYCVLSKIISFFLGSNHFGNKVLLPFIVLSVLYFAPLK